MWLLLPDTGIQVASPATGCSSTRGYKVSISYVRWGFPASRSCILWQSASSGQQFPLVILIGQFYSSACKERYLSERILPASQRGISSKCCFYSSTVTSLPFSQPWSCPLHQDLAVNPRRGGLAQALYLSLRGNGFSLSLLLHLKNILFTFYQPILHYLNLQLQIMIILNLFVLLHSFSRVCNLKNKVDRVSETCRTHVSRNIPVMIAQKERKRQKLYEEKTKSFPNLIENINVHIHEA